MHLSARKEMSLRTFDGFQVVFTEKLLEMKALDQDSQKYHAIETTCTLHGDSIMARLSLVSLASSLRATLQILLLPWQDGD